jgi:tetratricopeptide (TPR) repeat protein
MSANTASWRSAHGKLWYDDRWYRIAWIVWPQAVGALLFLSLWLYQPAGQDFIPWARPVPETPKNPPAQLKLPPFPAPLKQSTAPALAQPPPDILAPCKSGGDYGQIIQACSSLLASGTLKGNDIPYGYWHRGWAYYSTRQYQLAMNDYNQAISIAPNAWEFYEDRGALWLALAKHERALQDFDQVILLKPNYAIAHVNRGIAYRKLNRPNEALAALTKAISIDSTQKSAYEHRAFIYEDRSDWRAMFDDAVKLIEVAPYYRMGYEFRGHAYLEVGQHQAAVADFTKAISIDPTAIYGYRMRGRAYYFLNQFDNAMADFEAALRIDATDSSTISYINDLKRKRR